jgi:ADP-ribose pyrophosphatase YjhB (NUDIX family)
MTCVFEDGGRARLRHAAVHAIVEKDDSLLLVKRAPHLSEGALRELREETGWEGRVVSLLRINSRPDRPHEDRQNIAFDFVIEPLEKRGEPDAESTDVQWIPIDRVLSLDLAFDHMDSVRAYLDARRRAVATPILI